METTSASLWEDLGPAFAGAVLRTETGLWHRTDGLGILYPGKTTTFVGESESMKTFAALAASVEVVRDDGLVFFLDYEMSSEQIAGRLLQLGADASMADNFFYKAWPEDQRELMHLVNDIVMRSEGREALVIVDSVDEFLYSLGVDPNAQAAGSMTRDLLGMPLNHAGVTLLLIDHASGSAQGRVKSGPAGSFRKLANVDLSVKFVVDKLRPQAGEVGYITLYIDKDRPGTLRAATPQAASGTVRSSFGQMIVDSKLDPTQLYISVEPGSAMTTLTMREQVRVALFRLKAFDEKSSVLPSQVHHFLTEQAEERAQKAPTVKSVNNALGPVAKQDGSPLETKNSFYWLNDKGKKDLGKLLE